MLRTFTVFFTLTALAAAAFGESGDRHLNSGETQALFQKSTYAHGYMHGYEDGFHNADIDIHMGRGERAVTQMKDFKDCVGYQKEFGDRRSYRNGYQQGFKEGYADGIDGREFRAIAGARNASTGLTPSADALADRSFDDAFSKGYESGRSADANSLRHQAHSDYALNLCQSKVPQSQATKYCDAFVRGFSLGFADAVASIPRSGTHTAQTGSQERPLK